VVTLDICLGVVVVEVEYCSGFFAEVVVFMVVFCVVFSVCFSVVLPPHIKSKSQPRLAISVTDGSWVDAALADAPVMLAVVSDTSAEMLAATIAVSTGDAVSEIAVMAGPVSVGFGAFKTAAKSKDWAAARRHKAAATMTAFFMMST